MSEQDCAAAAACDQPAPPTGVCCITCGRRYVTPLDLPPVIIRGITNILPAQVIRELDSCVFEVDNPKDKPERERFLARIHADDRETVRNMHLGTVPCDKCTEIAVRMGDGRAVTCLCYNWGINNCYNVKLLVNERDAIFEDMVVFDQHNPFVVSATPISVRERWASNGLKPIYRVHANATYLLPSKKAYVDLDCLKFVSPTRGYFYIVCGNREDAYQADEPMFRVNFELA
jgi:hypothetical protein